LTEIIRHYSLNLAVSLDHLLVQPCQETNTLIDEMIREIEENYEVLDSVVPGSRLHEIINNPVDEGIDEG